MHALKKNEKKEKMKNAYLVEKKKEEKMNVKLVMMDI